MRERHYDLVVVDAVATGHITGQLAAPQAIKELVQVGLVRDQTRLDARHPRRPGQTGVVIVAAPEEMPVNETLELAERLEAETVVDLAAVVVNRVLPELFGRGEEEVFEQLARPPAPTPADVLAEAVGGPVPPLLDGAAAGGHPAPHPGRAPRPAARRAARRHAAALRAVPVPAQPRRSGHQPGRRSTSARSSGY